MIQPEVVRVPDAAGHSHPCSPISIARHGLASGGEQAPGHISLDPPAAREHVRGDPLCVRDAAEVPRVHVLRAQTERDTYGKYRWSEDVWGY